MEILSILSKLLVYLSSKAYYKWLSLSSEQSLFYYSWKVKERIIKKCMVKIPLQEIRWSYMGDV